MTYVDDTDKVIRVLDKCSTRGLLSEPVPSQYSFSRDPYMVQTFAFTSEELQTIRRYLAKYVSVLRQIDYPQESFFTGRETRSASLLQMFLSMLNDKQPSPDYAAANAQRLKNALDQYYERFEAVDLEIEMNQQQ